MAFLNAQKIKFSIKDFFSKYDQIRRKLRIWLHVPKKSLMKNFIFCAVSADLFDDLTYQMPNLRTQII